jgi:hypothetical protein
VGEEKGPRDRHDKGAEGGAITPDMFWPRKTKGQDDRDEKPGRVMRLDPSARGRRIDHPSLMGRRPGRRIVLTPLPEPTLVLTDTETLVDLSECGNGCGKGRWCEACRAEIRAEALKWLRELNVPKSSQGKDTLSWSRAWHHEILLADR